MKASTATSDNSSDTKPNAREYPFLEINMGPFGKPTIRTHLSPRLNKSLTHILGHLSHIFPMCSVGDANGQILSLHTSILNAALSDETRKLFVIHITDAFEKQ